MSAPKRVKVDVEGTLISAFVLPEMAVAGLPHVVCKHCAPERTKMKLIAEVKRHSRDGERDIAIFECPRCGRQWAVPYVQRAAPESSE
jgi:hypothetical protein